MTEVMLNASTMSSILLTQRSSSNLPEPKILNLPPNRGGSATLPRFVAKMGFLSQLCTCCFRSVVRVSDDLNGSCVRVVDVNSASPGSSHCRSSISVPTCCLQRESGVYTTHLHR